jgi:hypothetical protein
MLGFSISYRDLIYNFLTLWIPLKKEIGDEREGDFMDNFIIPGPKLV